MARRIDLSAWEASYKDSKTQGAKKLVDKFTATTGIVDAMTSDSAEANFKDRVVSSLALAKRRFKLSKLTDSQLHQRMREIGERKYKAGIEDNASKARNGFAPFAPVIEGIRDQLPARTDDPDSNIDARVKPFGRGLRDKAKELYGAS